MDNSFKARVDKVFGSIASSASPTLQSSLWSISDQVERRKWRRCMDTNDNDRDELPCSSSFDDLLKKDRGVSRGRKFEDEDDGGEELDGSLKRGHSGEDEWDIKSSIGLDRTLDYEEEEDAYDKVASGSENTGDCLYMRNVSKHKSYLNSQNVLQNSLHGFKNDSRANHLAAKVRLKEDEAESQTFDSVMCDSSECKQPLTNVDARPKSILKKRKDVEENSKPQKHVRFDPSFANNCEETSIRNDTVSDHEPPTNQNASMVPDYLVNPSKYTRYSLDSTSEINEDSDSQACIDIPRHFQNSNVKSGSEQVNASADNPKRVMFIPKREATDAEVFNESNEVKQNRESDDEHFSYQAGFAVSIAAGKVQGEMSAIEEDKPETNSTDCGVGSNKPVRRYRTISRPDDTDS